MSNQILLKRSSVANAIPTTANVALGELAINTYDGNLFTKIDNGVATIINLTQNQTITLSGDVTGSGQTAITTTLANTAVTAGTYGSSTSIPTFTVDSKGRITSASNNAVSFNASNIANGNSNVNIGTAGGNITVSVGGTSNVAVFATTGEYITGLLSVTGNITAGNVSATNYTGTNVSVTGTVTATSTVGGVITGTSTSVTGNVTSGNILSTGLISTSGNIIGGGVRSTSSATAPSNPTVGDFWYNTSTNVQYRFTFDGTNYYWIDDFGATVGSGGTFSAIINGTSQANIGVGGGNLAIVINGTSIANFTANGIENAQANATGNIGTASNYFNTVFAKATSAQYADLAEKYLADEDYPPGTVVIFDGDAEVTQSTVDHDSRVAGVVSTNPSYTMNAGLEGTKTATVALTGRVPCQVQGPVTKGQILVSGTQPGTAMAIAAGKFQPGVVIGKSLEAITDNSVQTIEVAVGRF